jgi:hypothetical protein
VLRQAKPILRGRKQDLRPVEQQERRNTPSCTHGDAV